MKFLLFFVFCFFFFFLKKNYEKESGIKYGQLKKV
jgi:hypothetical protein